MHVRHPAILAALAAVWAAALVLELSVLWTYDATPGLAASAPTRWPDGSRVTRALDRPTLVVMLHPRCPCSRATLEELDRLLTRLRDRVDARVVFVAPRGLAGETEDTDLWRQAARIRSVVAIRDDEAVEARRFNVFTSGQTMLYGTDGRLLFSGGITPSRGHPGDNMGVSTIVALVSGQGVASGGTPVFGCSLVPEHTDAAL